MTSPRQMSITDETEFTSSAETARNSTIQHFYLHGPVDITLYVLSLGLFGMSCYVSVVVCMFLHRFLRMRRISQAKATSSVLATGFGKLSLCMKFVVAVISLLCFVHFLLEQILLHSDCCDVQMKHATQIVYGFVVTFTYVFFWLRQRVLYDAPAMKLFHSKLSRILSWLSLALVIITSVVQIVTTSFLNQIENPAWIYVFWLLGCLLVQMALMSLFLYPLKKHGSERRKAFSSRRVKRDGDKAGSRPLNPNESGNLANSLRDSNIFTVCSSKGSNGSSSSSVTKGSVGSANSMYRATRRCVVCASVSFVTDIITGVFMITVQCQELNSHEVLAVARFLFDLNLVINSTFVIGCLTNWKFILFPKCFRSVTNRAHYSPPITTSEISVSVNQKVIPNFHYREESE